MKKNQQQLQWYDNELIKDQKELNYQKEKFIESLKGLTKKDIIPVKTKKLTIWQKIMKIIMG